MKTNRLSILSVSICFCSFSIIHAQNYTINTVAGNGTPGYSGDTGPATAAQIGNAYGVYVDASGNTYIPDGGNDRVRIVNSGGIINTFAGNGTAGFSGDLGQATAAELSSPAAVTGDASGNIYIADGANERIRLVNASGIINTIAGNGTAGYSGDGGQASAAELNFPACVALDASGNIYIADLLNQRIRKIAPSGRITTIAGNGTSGFSGDLGQATAAELANPFGVAVDGSGNIYIADQFNNRIRMVNPSGIITTIVGTGAASYSGDLGPATAATLDRPFAVSLDAAGNLYIADFANDRIRKVDNTGIISTIAGNGVAAYSGDGGPATAASLHGPTGISLDLYDNLYITDQSNDRIRELTINCTLTATITSQNGVTPCTGKAWVTASNGTLPYKYSWSPGGATTDTAKGLCSGNYCCTITDNVGCVDTVCIGVVDGIPEINNPFPIKIFPNPTNGIFTISGLSKGMIVELYNYLGEKVNNIPAESSIEQFNISDKTEGIYLVRVLSKNGEAITQSKIIKVN
jgi:sugar lactone lactonase YvrE